MAAAAFAALPSHVQDKDRTCRSSAMVLSLAAVAVVMPTFCRFGERRKPADIVIDLVDLVVIVGSAAAVGPTSSGQKAVDGRGGGRRISSRLLKTENLT